MNKNVPASRNNARSNQNGNVSFHQPVINSISTKKNHSPPNITIIKTDSNAGQLKAQSQLPLRHTLSDNKYPNKRHVDNPKFEFHMPKNFSIYQLEILINQHWKTNKQKSLTDTITKILSIGYMPRNAWKLFNGSWEGSITIWNRRFSINNVQWLWSVSLNVFRTDLW